MTAAASQPQPRKRKRKSMRERVQTPLYQNFVLPFTYGIYRLLMLMVDRMSPSQVYVFARGMAMVAWWLSGHHRGRVLRNIEIAYGDRFSEKQRLALAKRVMANFFMTVFDLAILPRYRADGTWRHLIDMTPEQEAALEELMAHEGPVVFHTGHLGSWEFAGGVPGMFGKKLNFVYRPLEHPQVDADVRRMRTVHGNEVFAKNGALRGYTRTLRDGGWLGVIADQNAGEGCAFLDFFGLAAATEVRYFPLYQRFKPRCVTIFVLRDGNRFHFKMVGPFETEVRPDADMVEESMRLAQWYIGCVEQVAREHPDQYLWTHKRYARRPVGVPGVYDGLFKPIDPAVIAAQPKAPIPPLDWKAE